MASPTWGFDLTPAANATIAKAGGRIAASVAELAAACDVVLVLVVTAAQTEALLFGDGGLAAHLKAGSVLVCSAKARRPARSTGWATGRAWARL